MSTVTVLRVRGRVILPIIMRQIPSTIMWGRPWLTTNFLGQSNCWTPAMCGMRSGIFFPECCRIRRASMTMLWGRWPTPLIWILEIRSILPPISKWPVPVQFTEKPAIIRAIAPWVAWNVGLALYRFFAVSGSLARGLQYYVDRGL